MTCESPFLFVRRGRLPVVTNNPKMWKITERIGRFWSSPRPPLRFCTSKLPMHYRLSFDWSNYGNLWWNNFHAGINNDQVVLHALSQISIMRNRKWCNFLWDIVEKSVPWSLRDHCSIIGHISIGIIFYDLCHWKFPMMLEPRSMRGSSGHLSISVSPPLKFLAWITQSKSDWLFHRCIL